MAEIWYQECAAPEQDQEFQLSTYDQRVNVNHAERDHCGCKGFEFRRKCKHVTESRESVCTWTDLEDGGEVQSFSQQVGCVCPKCGGPTVVKSQLS